MKFFSLLLAVLTLLLFSPMVGLLAAAETTAAKGIHSLDFAVLGLYVIGTIYLGYFISKRQKNRDDYFTGGGNMSPLLIGVSLFATLLSTISYLGMPGEAAGKGPNYIYWLFSTSTNIPVSWIFDASLLHETQGNKRL